MGRNTAQDLAENVIEHGGTMHRGNLCSIRRTNP